MRKKELQNIYKKHVNPDYLKLLKIYNLDRNFIKANGTKLFDDCGTEYTDFLSGFGVHNIGHNHPKLINILKNVLDLNYPSFLNFDTPSQAALLAQKLNEISHQNLSKTIFANSGAEIVEISLKMARAATGKSSIVACHHGYHGLTINALSLMDDNNHRKPFGISSDDVYFIDFGDSEQLDRIIQKVKPGAFILEPIQGEGGINIPSENYYKEISDLCESNNVLLIMDEIQTGFGRTGQMFATPFNAITPDILLIGKALSGGIIPITAAIFTNKIYKKSISGLKRCFLYDSTFSAGSLATIAGLETVKIIQNEKLCDNANTLGSYLIQKLQNLTNKYRFIKDIRGKGLFIGIEFQKPKGNIFSKLISEDIFDTFYSYLVTAILFNKYSLITQPCSVKINTLRIEPPLTITKSEIDYLIKALTNIFNSIANQTTAYKLALKYFISHKHSK